MKPNTFDIPAYKFAIIIPAQIIIAANDKDYEIGIQQMLSNVETFQVPFSEFDGLTVKETLDLVQQYGIFFVGYIGGWPKAFNNPTPNCSAIINILFTPNMLQNHLDLPLDIAIVNYFEDYYAEAFETEKKAIRCFFERYQDPSHEDTVARVAKLERKPGSQE